MTKNKLWFVSYTNRSKTTPFRTDSISFKKPVTAQAAFEAFMLDIKRGERVISVWSKSSTKPELVIEQINA